LKEIKALTTLRAFAAFLVFMYHYAYLFAPHQGVGSGPAWLTLLPVWRSGQIGVSIFFVLSGFLITRIYYDEFADGTGSLRWFYVKRFARIWPLFLLFAAVQHVAMLAQGQHVSPSWLITGTMTQGFFRDLRHAGLPTAWSLTIEESFYALAPLLFVAIAALALGRSGPQPWTAYRVARFVATMVFLSASLAGIGLGAMLLIQRLGWTYAGLLSDREFVFHSTLAGRFPEFAVGMACAFVHRAGVVRRLATSAASALSVGSFVTIGTLLALKDFTTRHNAVAASYACTYSIVLLTGVLILALAREEAWASRVLSGRLLVYLGKVSYGFYLMQASVLMVPLLFIARRCGPLRVAVLYVLMNLFCAACQELWEQPARSFIVRRLGGGRRGPGGA